jgi:Protein of unknown function (DUF3006)
MMVVDRIEGTVAVVEVNGTLVDIPLLGLPPGVKEGDLLEVRILPREEVAESAAAGEGAAVLERLKKRFPQGPDSFDL